MVNRCILSCLAAVITLSSAGTYAAEGGSATLKTSVRFPSDSIDGDQQSEEISNIDQVSSPTQHATSSSSFSLITNGGPTFNNHQRDNDKENSQGFSQGYIFPSVGDQPLRATTYGPPRPVGMKYRMRRPVNLQHNTNIQHRFRGNVHSTKHGDSPSYKVSQGFSDPPTKYPFAVQPDVSPYRKYYKKPPELPLIRKTFAKPKSPAYHDPYNKNEYEENFSKASSFEDDYNRSYQQFSSEDKDRPFKSDSELDRFSKPFFDNFFNKQTTLKDSFHDTYYPLQTTIKPAPAPARNLSKYYKKPVNHFPTKQFLSEYKSPGQIFSEPLDYARPHYKSLSTPLSGSGASASGEWTPINAPQGAVPAKAYDIPAPDLSQDKRNFNLKRGTYEDSLRHDVVVGTKKFNKAGNSEEVVSAVVMVKQ